MLLWVYLFIYLCISYSVFFARYDYENCESAPAEKMIANLEQMIVDPSTVGKSYTYGGKTFKIAKTDNFEYTDPIDQSVSRKQASVR